MFGGKVFLAILSGLCTEKMIAAYKKRYDVVGIITDKNEQEYEQKFDGGYNYNIINKIEEKIIIVDDLWNNDFRVAFNKIFIRHGLWLGTDYIYGSMQGSVIDTNLIYEMVNRNLLIFPSVIKRIIGDRKFVMAHGNCQTQVIISMLGGSKEFAKKYVTCIMPHIWEKVQKPQFDMMIESGIFSLVDYLFIQNISDNNKFGYEYSTEYILSLVPEYCKTITISNLFFLGYFPQYKKICNPLDVNFLRGKIQDATEYVDINVLKMIIEDKDDEEIVKNIKRLDYYEKEEIISRIEKELENFKFKEENIDIKMWDYLNENYRKDLLFATSNHPIKEVMKEFTRRILKSLNIEDLEISCSDDEIQEPMPKEWRYLVYPCVLKNLGIKRDIEYSFRAFLTEEEKKIIEGINKAEIVQEQHCGALTYYEIKCDFDTYMRIYVRCLRASLSLL